jgi:putative flippase GtrA
MTSAKGMALDFLNFIFALLLVGFCILYFIAGDNFENFKNILRSLVPFAGLGVIFMIRLKFWRERGRKVEREGGGDAEITITFTDRLKMDLFVFSLPAAVCLVAFILERTISSTAIVAAVAVFVIAYIFERWLLRKARG